MIPQWILVLTIIVLVMDSSEQRHQLGALKSKLTEVEERLDDSNL